MKQTSVPVLQQHVLALDLYVLQQPVLPLVVPILQCTLACAAAAILLYITRNLEAVSL
jgi:hypothetical protein